MGHELSYMMRLFFPCSGDSCSDHSYILKAEARCQAAMGPVVLGPNTVLTRSPISVSIHVPGNATV